MIKRFWIFWLVVPLLLAWYFIFVFQVCGTAKPMMSGTNLPGDLRYQQMPGRYFCQTYFDMMKQGWPFRFFGDTRI